MGYSHFDGNEQDLMEVFLKEDIDYKTNIGKETIDGYSNYIKSLLRKKMIKKSGSVYSITDRGRSAITQQIRTGEYWVGSLKKLEWNNSKQKYEYK